MTNPAEFSIQFLATCVEEYIKRSIAVVREDPSLNDLGVNVNIMAAQYRHDGEYTIKHNFSLGDSYDKNGRYAHTCTNNCISGAYACVNRVHIDEQNAPNTYSALLPAPEVELVPENDDADTSAIYSPEDSGEEQVSSDEGEYTPTDPRD